MAKIKKINYFDILHVKKLISVVCSDNVMSYRRLLLLSVPITAIQNFLYNPYLRRLPETYVISDNQNNLKGIISVKAQHGNPYKWQIKRLFLGKNTHEEGKQLVDYIIAKFGARGVDTFYVSVNDTQNDLIDLFINGCGFRYCSTESLWSVSNNNFMLNEFDEKGFKLFKNSDAQRVAELFNDNLITLYKSSLQKNKEEFYETLCRGFDSEISYKYIFEDDKNKPVKAFIEIKTQDNKNYFIDIIVSPQYFDYFPQIFSFAVKKIRKRNKNIRLYIKNRKYLQCGELYENYFKENRFELLQNNAVLVKDFFKAIKEQSKSFNEAFIINGFEI